MISVEERERLLAVSTEVKGSAIEGPVVDDEGNNNGVVPEGFFTVAGLAHRTPDGYLLDLIPDGCAD